jgi:lipopolysaccharide export system permease protein
MVSEQIGMKRLHLYIIKSFIGPFFVTLVISLFVLLMQFLWVYLDELVGKGLDFGVILEFIVYTMAMLMTNALPLAMLLASIMTFGDLGENNELLAMKAAGISLYRIMKPVVVLSILLSIGAFYFSNQVIPVAFKKLYALMYSIRELRPEIVVKEGVFSNEIEGFSIKVGKKSKNGDMLYDIMIYDHRELKGNDLVILADSGKMKITKDKKYMMLSLYSGHSYKELESKDRRYKSYPSRIDKFQKQTIYTPLLGMELERRDESVVRGKDKGLNNKQILIYQDSIGKAIEKQRIQYAAGLNYITPLLTKIRQLSMKDTMEISPLKFEHYIDIDSVVSKTNHTLKLEIIGRALNNARSNVRTIQIEDEELKTSMRTLNKFGIEWHKKYTFALACIIFLLIGAPLGAIIRKGGLGMPLVISVLLFIFYWIMSTTGEKFARESVSSVWHGVWFTSLIFLPAGLFLTYMAANDSIVFNINAYLDFFRKFNFFKKKKVEEDFIEE